MVSITFAKNFHEVLYFPLHYGRALTQYFLGDKKLLRSRSAAGPVLFLLASFWIAKALFLLVYSDDPFGTFELPIWVEKQPVLYTILPVPLLLLYCWWIALYNLPTYFAAKLLGYKPDLRRVIIVNLYFAGLGVLLVVFSFIYLLKADDLEDFFGDYRKVGFLTIGLIHSVVHIVVFLQYFRFSSTAYRMAWWKYLILISSYGFLVAIVVTQLPRTAPFNFLRQLFCMQIGIGTIDGVTMYPTVPPGAVFISNAYSYALNNLKAGDVVMLASDNSIGLGRIFARGGQNLEIKSGKILVSGIEIRRHRDDRLNWMEVPDVVCFFEANGGAIYRVCDEKGAMSALVEAGDISVVVPEGHFAVMPDFRDDKAYLSLRDKENLFQTADVLNKIYYLVSYRRSWGDITQ